RPNIQSEYFYHMDVSQWTQNLETSKSIVQKIQIILEKFKPYRSLVQKGFPHRRIDIELSRFWQGES
ncbi:unnamed protein product, partial [Rotaria sp. Silwood2]